VASSLQSVVRESPLELARYVTEIERLEDTLAGLKSERAQLESYSNGFRSVFAPVQSLPTELFVEIFDLCSPPGANVISDTTTAEEETDRIAKNYLLQLSQVCSRWHGIVMDTPRLWSTIAVDLNVWPKSSTAMLLDLVTCSLKRSAECPLVMQIAVDAAHPIQQPILEMFAQHSHRWRSVYLWMEPRALSFLVIAKGNLPLLEDLEISSADTSANSPYVDDVFSIAPRLKTFLITGWPSSPPRLAWEQILYFSYENHNDTPFSLGMLPLLTTHARFRLLIHASPSFRSPELRPVISSVSELDITFTSDSIMADTAAILGAFFGCLILPQLTHLRFLSGGASRPHWNQSRFLHFASQSSLCNTLTMLEVYALIEEHELQECLSVLPMLKTLRVWDRESPDGLEVITDNLLHRLTWKLDEPNLVPHLNVLTIGSLLRFRDDSLLECVTSRIVPGRCGNEPFTANVLCLWHCSRKLSAEFIAQLSGLQESGDFRFTVEHEAEDEDESA